MIGQIHLTLEGATLEQTERCRLIINKLFEYGFFNVSGGSVLVHFNPKGEFMQVETNIVRHVDNPAPISIDKISKDVTIKVK